MTWTKRDDSHSSAPKPAPRVYQEHVQILRDIKAPEKLIKLAERVADSTSASSKK